MPLLTLLFLPLLAAPAMAGCFVFAGAAPETGCRDSASQVEWKNQPAGAEILAIQKRVWEPAYCCYDRTLLPADFPRAVATHGEAEFLLHAAGPHLVEVFLFHKSGDRNLFYTFESNGRVLDQSAAYQHPQISLVAVVEGGTAFRVRSPAERYGVAAVRWTSRGEFEKQSVPLLRRRLKELEQPFLADGVRRMPQWIEQVAARLQWSQDRAAADEGLLGLLRITYWRLAEAAQSSDFERLGELLHLGSKRFPGNRLFRQMASGACAGQNQPRMAGEIPQRFPCASVQPVPWEVALPPAPASAPGWALAQRRLAARLETLTRWWVENRQQPNGELGGGWGDDVEILRSWGPQAIGFGSEVAAQGMVKLAEGLWTNGGILHGFAREISDSEHSAEDIADTQPLLAAFRPDDPGILARLRETTACSEHWIVQQPDRRWRFRGSWFNCREFSPDPRHAIDVHYNVRAMGPALWYAYLSRDPAIVERVARWAESWVEAMRSDAHGKPRGILPPVVISADGSYLVRSERWDKPDAFWDYFHWSGYSQEGLTNLLLAVYDLTGDRRWLDAAGETFQIFARCREFPALCDAMRKNPEAYFAWRALSGDTRYDAAVGKAPSTDPAAALPLLEQLATQAEQRIRNNFDLYTSEPIWTDRIPYGFLPPAYRWYLFGGDAPRGERYPTFAVTWPPVRGSVARAVMDARADRLTLRLYNFENRKVDLPVRLWRLRRGGYTWDISTPAGVRRDAGRFDLKEPAQKISLPLPPREEVVVTLRSAR